MPPRLARLIIAFVVTATLSADRPASAKEPGLKRDANGCRILSALPRPGVHPRVYFTADEYPRMRARLNAPRFKAKFGKIQKQVLRQVKNQWGDFARADLSNPTDAEILKYFISGEGRNQQWGMVSVMAVLNNDQELKSFMAGVITNYARIMLASRARAVSGNLKRKTGTELNKIFNIWKRPSFDVGVSWTLGSAGYAVCYDVLHDSMSKAQRDMVRKAIATAIQGRVSYGNGMPRGFAASNHYGYHGDLAGLCAAIEGEEGFDPKTWDGICQVLRDYWEVGFTRAGACHEDGYGPNLGMRAGSRGFMVLARRGYNIFKTEKYRRFLAYITQEWAPYPGGAFMGGASGGPYGELYPTSFIIAQYMYPESVTANYNYRHVVGDNFDRRIRWQGWLDYLLYGSDWRGPEDRRAMLEGAGLPLSVFYPVRGKLVVRSDWGADALYATLDARPDAHLIGHDKVDRGNFTISALGRMWASTGDFHWHNLSTENSLVHIDGKAEAWKAPSARFLWHADKSAIAGGGADLKYAYDWAWTPPWPKMSQKFAAPWEPEMNGPVDLGWPAAHRTPEVPDAINASETGYAHTNNLHRKPYNPVEKNRRSLFLVRGKHPYVVICDDIKKDAAQHRYEWYMQIPVDLEAKRKGGGEVVLSDKAGGRSMLVRFLQAAACETRIENYVAAEPKKGPAIHGKRLIGSVTAVEPGFVVLLFPFRDGEALPETTWNDNRTCLTVAFGDQRDVLTFTTSKDSGIKIALER